jgi:hypothetical protein
MYMKIFIDHGKILNLLIDTFHSTKYFHAHLYTLACHFLCRLFYLFKYHENFMVGYLGCDYATVIFLDFSMH